MSKHRYLTGRAVPPILPDIMHTSIVATSPFKCVLTESYSDRVLAYPSWYPTDAKGVLTDGTTASCTGDCTLFKGAAVRGLVALQRVAPTPQVATLLATSMDSLWDVARSSKTGLFNTDWSTAATAIKAPAYIGENIAAVMAIGLYTQLVCDFEHNGGDITRTCLSPCMVASMTKGRVSCLAAHVTMDHCGPVHGSSLL